MRNSRSTSFEYFDEIFKSPYLSHSYLTPNSIQAYTFSRFGIFFLEENSVQANISQKYSHKEIIEFLHVIQGHSL